MMRLGQTLFGRKLGGHEPSGDPEASEAVLLDRCLQALDRGEDVDRILQRYPDHAEALRPLLGMVPQVQEHYAHVPEPPGGLRPGRARVVRAAAQAEAMSKVLQPSAHRTPRRSNMAWAWRWVGAALLVVLALVPLAPRIVHAANQSVPGGPLYGIKLTSEDFHFASVADPELRVVLSLALMDERVEELKTLAVKHKPIPDVVLSRMLDLSEQALASVAATPDTAMLESLEFVAHRTERQADALVDLMAYAEATQHGTLLQAQAICWRTHQLAVMALSAPQAFRQMYQGEEMGRGLALPIVGDSVELDRSGDVDKP
jgi:hypothetical protein